MPKNTALITQAPKPDTGFLVKRVSEMAIAKVFLVMCQSCKKELELETPRLVPCHLTVVCPFCETIRYCDVFEEDVPVGLLDGSSVG